MMKPHVLAIIELKEGCRLTSQVIVDPAQVKIGMQVEAAFRKLGQEEEEEEEAGIIHYGYKFRPAAV